MRLAVRFVRVLALVLLPTLAFAQATITGTVRDTSGAVLPGVTVEASSPALIEKVRTSSETGSSCPAASRRRSTPSCAWAL